MSFKAAIVLCAQALLIQTISAQCYGTVDGYGYGAPWGAAPLTTAPCTGAWGAPYASASCAGAWGAPYAAAPYAEWAYAPAATLSASNGPGLAISSASSIIPAGVSVLSENVYEGGLAAGGALPFLGTVAIEGALPTAGAGAIAYGCGSGAVGITAEDIGAVGFAGIAGPLGYGAGAVGPIGYGTGFTSYGPCGCGAIY